MDLRIDFLRDQPPHALAPHCSPGSHGAHDQNVPELPPQQPGSPPVEPDEGQLPPVGEPNDPEFQRIPLNVAECGGDFQIVASVAHVAFRPQHFGPARNGRRRCSRRRMQSGVWSVAGSLPAGDELH